jgi:uncharacterized hydrophobic protein (TIGR00271 family)
MIVDKLVNNLIHFLSLDTELEDPEIIHEEIVKGITFKGTNLWILMFAIIIASVGLNMNSTAVIIGAMLISPLMGPINGMGYSIATYDLALFRMSIKNFGFAVIASLTASTVYFALSPVSTAYSELLARTSPTIYDVIIALFGGFAGIMAISSRLKGNVIPGVAIATALMPPLCTAGYGIATAQLDFFLGAFYLFTINSIFIAFASVWISQLLKFPIRGNIEDSRKRNINRAIYVIITIVLLPSLYFGYQLNQQEKFKQNAIKFVNNISIFEGNYLLKSDINEKKGQITLTYGGNQLNDFQKNMIKTKSLDFNLPDANILIEQGLVLNGFSETSNEVFMLKNEVLNLKRDLQLKKDELDSLKLSYRMGRHLLNEISALYPQIKSCAYADTYVFQDSLNQSSKRKIVLMSYQNPLVQEDKEKINFWLRQRINNDSLIVLYNPLK